MSLSMPHRAYAQLVFSEIMYAPEEGVAYEWFEIFNTGEDDVDITDWKFNDGNNHVFEKPPKNGGQGVLVISSGAYAIVAKEADTFLGAHVGFSGTVIDASFSLSDAGDTLTLIDENGTAVDSVSYGNDAGAKKNGFSLHLIGGVWSSAIPTPGDGVLTAVSQGAENEEAVTEGNSESASENIASFPVEPQIFVFAGDDRTVTVGADTEFNGRAVGLEGEPLAGARYIWNFGDGARIEGKSVLHHYRYPGTYQVILDASSGEYAATDRFMVTAREADIAITDATPDVIALANYGDYELNLSWWVLESDGLTFTLPEHTIILPEREIRLPGAITGLSPKQNEDVVLKYPNEIPVVLLKSSKPPFENKPVSNTQSSRYSIVGMAVPEISQDLPTSSQDKVSKDVQHSEQAAVTSSFMNGTREEYKGIVPWLLALTGIILLASASAIFLRRTSQDDITIID